MWCPITCAGVSPTTKNEPSPNWDGNIISNRPGTCNNILKDTGNLRLSMTFCHSEVVVILMTCLTVGVLVNIEAIVIDQAE